MAKQVTEEQRTEKKKQRRSVSYNIASFSNNLTVFKEFDLISEEDMQTAQEIQKRVMQKWTEKQFGIQLKIE